jgi:hypothetical protein
MKKAIYGWILTSRIIMNRHTKIAIFIAPFLIVGGYIAADYYDEEKKKNRNLFKLKIQGQCNLLKAPCQLTNKQLTLTLSDDNGITKVKSNHLLEKITFSLIDNNHKESVYQMNYQTDTKYWQAKTEISDLLYHSSKLKLRLIATVNKGFYFSEFYTWKD